jgi:hypothetical protein
LLAGVNSVRGAPGGRSLPLAVARFGVVGPTRARMSRWAAQVRRSASDPPTTSWMSSTPVGEVMRPQRIALWLVVSLAASWRPGLAMARTGADPGPGPAPATPGRRRIGGGSSGSGADHRPPLRLHLPPGRPAPAHLPRRRRGPRVGPDGRLRVCWLDTELNETDRPAHPGRWAAYVEGTAPNGTPNGR